VIGVVLTGSTSAPSSAWRQPARRRAESRGAQPASGHGQTVTSPD